MSPARLPDVAGFEPRPGSSGEGTPRTGQLRDDARPDPPPVRGTDPDATPPSGARGNGWPAGAHGFALLRRATSLLGDLSVLHGLSERVSAAGSLEATLAELLHAGAALVGARRGLLALHPSDGHGPHHSVGLGLTHGDIGALETVPVQPPAHGTADTAGPVEQVHPDIAADPSLPARHRDVAAQLGIAASYGLGLTTASTGHLGTVVWLYDRPAVPTEHQRELAVRYCQLAAERVAASLRQTRTERDAAALRRALLPSRLPRVPGVRLGVRHHSGVPGGGDWYDAMELPEGALGLSVGGVTGSGPGATAAMGRLRASLRAYAVIEGDDPVAVLSDLELLLHLTEPTHAATALFVHVEPARRHLVLAGAGHCPPLLVGDGRADLVETSLSAPLNMLACWEAPSAELSVPPGATLVLYTDGLLHRTGAPLDQALSRLRTAAAHAPQAARDDPDKLCAHLLACCLPNDTEAATQDHPEDLVLLAARFD